MAISLGGRLRKEIFLRALAAEITISPESLSANRPAGWADERRGVASRLRL
jgi:hypothetical protein